MNNNSENKQKVPITYEVLMVVGFKRYKTIIDSYNFIKGDFK